MVDLTSGCSRQFGRNWSIRTRITLLVLALAAPLNLLAIGVIWELARQEHATRYSELQYAARTVASGLDAYLSRHIALAEALAKSPALLDDDLSLFRNEAERAFPDTSETWLLVADLKGKQIMNLLARPRQPLPFRSLEGRTVQARALDLRSRIISGIYRGPLSNTFIATVEIPVFRNNQPFRELAVTINAHEFLRLLGSNTLPQGWLVGIADTSGRYVARSEMHDEAVGQPVSVGWRATLGREGITEFVSRDGDRLVNANATSALGGWTVGVAAKRHVIDAPVDRLIVMTSLLGAIVSLFSLGVAWIIARSITAPMQEVAGKASALVRGEHVNINSSVPELNEVWNALCRAVEERNRYEGHQGFLVQELTHRVKNTLSIVQAIAHLTLRAAANPEALSAFSARLASLGRAHELLTSTSWRGATIREIVVKATLPFAASADRTVDVSGPTVELSPQASVALSLMLHELATNAAKYGALSTSEGRVQVTWNVTEAPDGKFVEILWSEHGGPPVQKPTQQGFGSRLLALSAAQAQGIVDTKYNAAGLSASIRLPLVPADHAARIHTDLPVASEAPTAGT